jgi:glycerophosphoryl diester phosphodiesterase
MKRIIYLIGGVAILSLLACKSQKGMETVHQAVFPDFSTEAHRGGRGLMPENTIMAMKHAIDLGVTTLEMDTHVTGDKQVVVSHDAYLNALFTKTPDGAEITKDEQKNHIVYKMKYAELRKYDVGSKFYAAYPEQKKINTYIPRLADLIDSVQTYLKENNKKQVFYNIETKSSAKDDGIYNPEPAEFVKLLMDVIAKKKITPYVVIQSFDKRTIQLIHKNYPGVRTSYLVSDKRTFEEHIAELGYKPFIYSPAFKLVTPALVKKCHDQQIKIIPWTANTKSDIENLKAMKVDGIISDYPNLLVN